MRRLSARSTVWVLAVVGVAQAAVVAPPPGQEVVVISEHVLLVYDPLTQSQTIVLQHIFEGTSTPFGLLIPTPKPARVSLPSERLRKAIRGRLHPRGRVRRTLDIELVTWVGGCALREVGDDPAGGGKAKAPPAPKADASTLGAAPEPLHDWLLDNGFTVSPAQAAWLARLRANGWSVVGVVVTPRPVGLAPPPTLRGPVIAITHEADGPGYAAAHPPFALDRAGSDGPPLEVAVLTEWAVSVEAPVVPQPFFAARITDRDVARIGAEAGGLPWAFRRTGTLTAFDVKRPDTEDGLLRFGRAHPRSTIKPAPTPRLRAHHFRVPVELFLALIAGAVWWWMRFGRRRKKGSRLR